MKKVEEQKELKNPLWPAHEPKIPDLQMTLGDYRNDPPDAVKVEGVWYAVGYDSNFTSYSGGGTGPVRCRLYKAETLEKRGLTAALAKELNTL